LRRRAAHAARRLRGLTHALSAGHGVHRSDSARSRPTTVTRGQGAHMGATLRKYPAGMPSSAGHGVHRSDSIDRRGTHTQSNQTVPTSASPRLRVKSSARGEALSAGHGVHRSFRDRLRSSAAICPSAGH
jgi:hypothetical protein